MYNKTHIMCKARNIIHNFYRRGHSLFEFKDAKTPTTSIETLQKNVHHSSKCSIHSIYDIQTLCISYTHCFEYKRQKLADIKMSPYMDEHSYLSVIEYLQSYFHNKTFTVVQLNADYIYLYYDGECVNTLINNIITYHDINN